MNTTENPEDNLSEPSFDNYPFNEGDEVRVDWSEGMGPYNKFTGTIEDISRSAGEVVVSVVDYDAEGYGGAGKTHDTAPEWLDVIYTQEEN